jgi:hypothetical protein
MIPGVCRYEHVYTRDVCRKFLQNRCFNKDCNFDHVTEDEMEVNEVPVVYFSFCIFCGSGFVRIYNYWAERIWGLPSEKTP